MTDAEHHVRVSAIADYTDATFATERFERQIERLGRAEVAANQRVERSEIAVSHAKDQHLRAQQKLTEAIETGTAKEIRRADREEKYWAARVDRLAKAERAELDFHRKTTDAGIKSRQALEQ